MSTADTEWAVALFRKSVLKQAKFHRILELLDDPAGKTNLDIGADNGVISYLLRQQGGHWRSADLDERAVASIRQLVGDEVYRLEGAKTPFDDQSFDQVVIVDYLEHIADDRAFARGARADRQARRHADPESPTRSSSSARATAPAVAGGATRRRLQPQQRRARRRLRLRRRGPRGGGGDDDIPF